MDRTKKWIAAGAGVVIAVAAGTGIAFAAVDDDGDEALQGSALTRASAAALAHTGGGRVTETEHDDDDGDLDEGYYQVEVTLDDGREVDVHLDRSFRVIEGLTEVDRTAPDDAAPLDAATVERVGQAALADSPGGRVLDVDVDDDTGNYEVEVLGADGTVVDVTLDRDLRVLDRVPDLDRDDADDRS
jgi:uncharacterized membrane protein YkoI